MPNRTDLAIALLEEVKKQPISGSEELGRIIEQAIASSLQTNDAASPRLHRCVHALGLVYVQVVGKLPGYSNSDNRTHFERFVFQLDLPAGLRGTPGNIRKAIKALDVKRNPEFLAKLDSSLNAARVLSAVRKPDAAIGPNA